MVFLDLPAVITILLQGLLYGGILSLIAIGLTLIFGVSRVMNIAHGDFLVLGAIVTTLLFLNYRLNPFLSIAVVVPLFAGVGILFSLLMRKPMSARTAELSLAASILVTLGLSNLIEGIGDRVGALINTPFYSLETYGLGTTSFGGVTLTNVLILTFVTIILISIAMTILVYRTGFGALMRASMQDREVAVMLGADTSRVSMVTFAIGISLAAFAGTMDVLVTVLDPSSGLALTISALTVVVLGGLGSFNGALIGGFLLGFLTSFVEIVLDDLGQAGAAWGPAVPMIVMILVLIVRPSGLLRR